MLQFGNSRHKQVNVSSFSWRLRLDAPLEGSISSLWLWRVKGCLRDRSCGKHRTVFRISANVLPGPGDPAKWQFFLRHATWMRAKYSVRTWLPLRGRAPWGRAHSECLEVPWSLRSACIFRPCPRSLLPPSREAFMEAFLVDGPGGSQGGSRGRFRQVSLFRPTHQTEVLSGPRLVLVDLGPQWN